MYLLEELVVTFYDESIDGKSIVQCCEEVKQSNEEDETARKMIGPFSSTSWNMI
jgi:high-affinity K+ transport system ATPase subunit B